MSREENIARVKRALADHETWRQSGGAAGHLFSTPVPPIPDSAYTGDYVNVRGSTIFQGVDLTDQLLVDFDLDDADLSGLTMMEGMFSHCRIRRAAPENSLFKKTELHELRARDANFSGTRFIRTSCQDNDLVGARFDHCQLFSEGRRRCRLTDTTWTGATVANCSWWDVALTGVRFDGLTGTLMPPDPTADNWWTHHATEVFFHINSHGGDVGWHRGS